MKQVEDCKIDQFMQVLQIFYLKAILDEEYSVKLGIWNFTHIPIDLNKKITVSDILGSI